MRKNGFTLVEMMVVITVLSIVMGLVFGAFVSLQRQANLQMEYSNLSNKLAMFSEFFKGQIRMIGYDPKGSGKFGIVSAKNDSISYIYDANENGAFDDTVYSITLSGDSLLFFSNTNAFTIVPHVDSFALRYFDEAGNEILALPIQEGTPGGTFNRQVRRVEFYIKLGETYMGKVLSVKSSGDVIIKNMGG